MVENIIWGKGWLKTSEYRYIGGRGSKIALKNRHMIFESGMWKQKLEAVKFLWKRKWKHFEERSWKRTRKHLTF